MISCVKSSHLNGQIIRFTSAVDEVNTAQVPRKGLFKHASDISRAVNFKLPKTNWMYQCKYTVQCRTVLVYLNQPLGVLVYFGV